jgi:hypothetical protein
MNEEKMTFEDIKEYCKNYEDDIYWDIDVWTHGDDTVIRFNDKSRPLELSLSSIIGNSVFDSEIIKKQIDKIEKSFSDLWHDYYAMLEFKHFPEFYEEQ